MDDMEMTEVEYRKYKVEEDPEDCQKRAKLITKLLEEGYLDQAQEWIQKTIQDLDVSWPMIKEFHRPVLDTLLQKGEVESAQPLILHMNKHFSEEPRVKRMIMKARKALTQKMSASVFPGDLPITQWWDGPHLVSEEYLSEWVPGQIIEIEDGIVTMKVASLDENSQLEESEWSMPFSQLKNLATNKPSEDDYIRSRLEIGIYTDESVEICFH